MNKNKLVSLCAAAVMLFSQTTLSVQAENVGTKTYESDINMLNALGITQINVQSFDAEAKVSRTQFADAVMKMMSDGSYSAESFADMTESNEGMLFLKDINVLSGNEKGQFLPNNVITADEALKILLGVLGFGSVAESEGGWTSGYRKVASRIDLTDGVPLNYDSGLTNAGFVKLLTNAADTDILETETVGSGESYSRGEGITLLYRYRGIAKDRGIVTGNGFTDLYSDTAFDAIDNITVSDKRYKNAYEPARQYLGYTVDYYYDRDTEQLLYAAPYKQNNRVVRVSAEDILSYSAGEYTYRNENGKTEKMQINNETVIIYNGRFIKTNTVFRPTQGGVVFLDNDGDQDCDVLFIEDVSFTIVDSVNTDKNRISDKYSGVYDIALDDLKKSIILDENGTKLTVEDIAAGDILEVQLSNDKKYCTVKVVKSTVEGTAEAYDTENGINTALYVAQTEYRLSERVRELIKQHNLTEPVLGKKYVLYLSSNGDVVCFDETDDNVYRIGYIRKFSVDSRNRAEIKLLDNSGEWEIYPFADKVKINGVSTRESKLDGSSVPTDTVCKYSLNIHGEVDEIDLPDVRSDSLIKVYEQTSAMIKNLNTGYTVGQTSGTNPTLGFALSDATVFVLPKTETTGNADDAYRVATTLASVTTSSVAKYDICLYSSVGREGVGDIVLIKTTDTYGLSVSRNRKPAVVNKILRGSNENGEDRIFMDCINNGIDVRIAVRDERVTTAGESFPFESGDVIFYSLNAQGELELHDDKKTYDVLLDYNAGAFVPMYTNTSSATRSQFDYGYNSTPDSSFMLRFGAVYKTDGKLLFINNNYSDLTNTDNISVFDTTKSKVYVYDYDEKKFKMGTVGEASGYAYGNTFCSTAYVASNEGSSCVVIYP